MTPGRGFYIIGKMDTYNGIAKKQLYRLYSVKGLSVKKIARRLDRGVWEVEDALAFFCLRSRKKLKELAKAQEEIRDLRESLPMALEAQLSDKQIRAWGGLGLHHLDALVQLVATSVIQGARKQGRTFSRALSQLIALEKVRREQHGAAGASQALPQIHVHLNVDHKVEEPAG